MAAHVTTIVRDVSSPEACRAVVEEASQTLGTPEVFLHAVGRNERRPVLELGDDDWQSILTLNLSSAWWLGQEVGRRMVVAGRGRMVFVSSVSGLLAHSNHGPYAATKGGINQMMRVMAREWAVSGVTVNAVAPGYVETELTRAYLDADGHREELESLVPAGRLGRPAGGGRRRDLPRLGPRGVHHRPGALRRRWPHPRLIVSSLPLT